MKNGYLWAGLIVVIVVAIGLYFLATRGASSAPSTSSTPPASQTTSAPGVQTVNPTPSPAASAPTQAGAPAAQHFTVNGNDQSADNTTITVAKGTPVTITFGADSGTTYHGGLDFRSSVVSTGTITPGATKTVSFTANQSFSFQPYWPSTNIAKPYKINVVVTS